MAIADGVRVIDADTHVLEPHDLWTSRMSAAKWGDLIPHVVWDEEHQAEVWMSGDEIVGFGSAWAAHAGGDKWYPDMVKRWDEARAATPWAIDPGLRLKIMDTYGVYAQVLYPNVLLFGGEYFTRTANSSQDRDLFLECTRAYNDFLTDYASADPNRFVPIAALPFWDIPQSIAELQRAAGTGHKGVIFPQFPEFHGQPRLSDRHWDPLWAALQEARLPVNFHIGSGGTSDAWTVLSQDAGHDANVSARTSMFFIDNARTIAAVTAGGICHRFPGLKFVSVESGVSWIPFILQSLDWMWKNSSASWQEHPDYLLPSEFFRRQIYGCFFFESGPPLDAAIEFLGPGNVLYESDFPHPASMAPGPATTAVAPREYIETTLGHLPPDTLRKILHDNAASLYRLG